MTRSRPTASRRPGGFTLIELLVVILILAILIALLLPVINGAVRSAKTSAVGAEINQLAQALASFKAKYGDYPPSRVWLSENGNFSPSQVTQIAPGDITNAQLAQRTVAALRKFFPNANFSLSGPVFPSGSPRWYDFNGNGVFDQTPYILQGHQCLVFFLGGIPFQDAEGGLSATGFGKDPKNPFSNTIVGNNMYSNNRSAPLFEFTGGRLALDPSNNNGVPGYLDSLGNPLGGGLVNFLAYFSAYGNGAYDPNDVNFVETDASGTGPTTPFNGIGLAFQVGFPVAGGCASPGPNPYTTSTTNTTRTTWINPQTFQIISSGVDGLYGVGGQYLAENSTSALPFDASTPSPYNTQDSSIRQRERDNVANFHNGRLD
jgi:general secretion pathway protein G